LTSTPLVGFTRGIGIAIDDEEVRPVGGDDETFLSTDNEMVALELRPRRGAEEIGAAPGFGQGFGGDQLPLQERLEEFFLLLFRPEGVEGLTDDRRHGEGAGEGRPQDADLLEGGDFGAPGQAATALLFREAQTEQVPVSQCLDKLSRIGDLVPVHPPDQIGRDLPLDELPDLRLQSGLFRCQKDVLQHGNSSFEKIPCFQTTTLGAARRVRIAFIVSP